MPNKCISSNFFDQRNAAAYLPYVNIFATDKAFSRCLSELQLDATYKTDVYDVSSLNTLIEYIKGL